MHLLIALAACRSDSAPDGETVLGWASRHETTFASAEVGLRRLLSSLPSLPGDAFTCTALTLPPGTAEAKAEALRASLCRQQELLWHADRHAQEHELGTVFLNTTFQHWGVVGVELAILGPDGAPEWADHRGIVALADGVSATDGVAYAGVSAEEGSSGVPVGPARLGWGRVDLAVATVAEDLVAAELRPALEWRKEVMWHRAKAVARVLLLADGTPDAAFVQEALQP